MKRSSTTVTALIVLLLALWLVREDVVGLKNAIASPKMVYSMDFLQYYGWRHYWDYQPKELRLCQGAPGALFDC